jgi:pimeloyl-ACP methyl ester carboxylesterase
MSQKIYIIHGWTYNLDKWQPILPLLQKAGYDPVVLRVPGLTSPSRKVWDIDGYVDWLKGELAREPAPVVIGHSNGGRIALRFDNCYPGRLKRLILIDAAGVPQQQAPRKAKLTVLRALAKLGRPLRHLPVLKNIFYRLIGAQDYLQAPANMKKTMQNMLDANQLIDFAAVSTPTTLIWGEQDTQTPLADAKFMARHIPGAKLLTIKDGRHAPMFTHPQQVAAYITEALQ